MSHIEISGQKYRAEKMAPRQQFHLLRRLTPLMTSIGGAAMGLLDETKPKEEVFADIAACIGPMAEQLASMSDETVDYVLDACLTHVQRYEPSGETWHPIYVPQPRGAIRMYQDLDGAGELRLCGEVIRVNLTGFFGQMSEGGVFSLNAGKTAQLGQKLN